MFLMVLLSVNYNKMCNSTFHVKHHLPSSLKAPPPPVLSPTGETQARAHQKSTSAISVCGLPHYWRCTLTLTQLSRSSWESRHKHVDKHTHTEKVQCPKLIGKQKKPCWCVLVSYLLKTFQENATGVQHKKINSSSIRRHGSHGRKSQDMMLHQNGNFSAAHHNRDTVWVCVNSMMPSQNLTLSAVTHHL